MEVVIFILSGAVLGLLVQVGLLRRRLLTVEANLTDLWREVAYEIALSEELE